MKPQRLLVIGLLAGAAILVAVLLIAPRFAHTDMLSGYVEGEPLYPATPLAGRLVEMAVKRGDMVKAGDPLFSVDPTQGEATLTQAQAALAQAQSLAADARRGQRPAELGVLQANVAAANAQLTEAQKTLDRTRPLVETGAFSRAQGDAALAARDTAGGQVNAAQKQLEAARLGGRQGQVAAADQRVREAQAAVEAARARLADQTQKAPAAGRIEDVFFQLGEWTPASQPILSLIPEDRVRLRFFVPEGAVATYTIGHEVTFTCDGCAQAMRAQISYVSPRPEFTPPIIYSRDSRDRMVFLVEAQPLGDLKLAPGQPIDVAPLAPAARTP
ncbi:MAG: HlyD family efflux transporter periplasmic adaptor subunit [Hyphomonadaceae bacterium]